MKKIKKSQKGMTLLEVIIAMSIFSIATTGVTMAFAAAVKYNSLNQRRDNELSYQEAAVQKGNASGLELYNGHNKDTRIAFQVYMSAGKTQYKDQAWEKFLKSADPDTLQALADSGISTTLVDLPCSSYTEEDLKKFEEFHSYKSGNPELTFTTKTEKTVEKEDGTKETKIEYKSGQTLFKGMSEFQAIRSGKNEGVYDFTLKDFSSSMLGTNSVSWSDAADKYRIRFVNNSEDNVDVQLQIKSGILFEGSFENGYRHSSKIYTRTMAGLSSSGLKMGEYEETDPETGEVKKDENGNPIKHDVVSVPSEFEIGLFNENLSTETDSVTVVIFKNGTYLNSTTLDNYSLYNAENSTCNLGLADDGSITVSYAAS